jgi:hypothetical protein
MKIVILLTAVIFSSFVYADPLSQVEKEALTERLQNIREKIEKTLGSRINSIIETYRDAMVSDSVAYDFFLKCKEKVATENDGMTIHQFRAWKNQMDESLKKKSFRIGLRHQLAWAILTLKAAANPDKITQLSSECLTSLDSFYEQAELMEGEQGDVASGGALFLRAYHVENLKAPEWPSSQMQIAEVYNKVIMPSLRSSDKVSSLRNAWDARIRHEGLKTKYFTISRGLGQDKIREGDLELVLKNFREERLPDLLWQKELDLFRLGDQKSSALKMLKIIEENPAHIKSVDWVKSIQEIVDSHYKK